ncbi:MAG TPA: YncE family protein [Terriglobales bacterium]|nr:YncE family protein [Terriglobales bacterium]
MRVGKHKLLVAAMVLVLAPVALGAAFGKTSSLRQLAMVYIPGNPGFQAVGFVDGHLIISHSGADTVDIFNVKMRRVDAQLKMKAPRGIAVDEKGGKAYVADAGAGNIAVISTRTWKLENTIPVQLPPGPLALSPDGRTLYVGNAHSQSVSAIDLAKAQQAVTVPLGHVDALVYDPGRNLLYATLEDQAQVAVLDPALKEVRRYPLAASQPSALALDESARRLYVAVRYAVVALDADSGREVGRVAAPMGVDSLWLDPGSGKLYAASSNEVDVIRAGAGQFATEDQLVLTVRGHGIVFDPDRKLLLMPSGHEGRSLVLILKPAGASPDLQPPSQALMQP